MPRVIHTFSIHQVNYLSPNLIFENHMGFRQRVYQYALKDVSLFGFDSFRLTPIDSI